MRALALVSLLLLVGCPGTDIKPEPPGSSGISKASAFFVHQFGQQPGAFMLVGDDGEQLAVKMVNKAQEVVFTIHRDCGGHWGDVTKEDCEKPLVVTNPSIDFVDNPRGGWLIRGSNLGDDVPWTIEVEVGKTFATIHKGQDCPGHTGISTDCK